MTRDLQFFLSECIAEVSAVMKKMPKAQTKIIFLFTASPLVCVTVVAASVPECVLGRVP